VLAFQQYVNQYFGEQRVEETGLADATTMKYLEEFVSRGMTVPGNEPTQAPTAEPEPTDAPTQEPEPTEKPVVEPVVSPNGPAVSIGETVYDPLLGVIPEIDVSELTMFSWTYDGEVKGYMLHMTNANNAKKDLGKTTENFIELDLSSLSAGSYTLWVGAVPTDAQSEADVVWSAVPFTVIK